VTESLKAALPKPKEMPEAIIRLVVEYPREWDSLIDESALRKYAADAFEFHFVKRPQIESRVRIDEGQVVSSLSPMDLLGQYFDAAKISDPEDLKKLAQEIITDEE
jgi:exonuclease SbcD